MPTQSRHAEMGVHLRQTSGPRNPVMPAKAGIQSFHGDGATTLDPRLRGNDGAPAQG